MSNSNKPEDARNKKIKVICFACKEKNRFVGEWTLFKEDKVFHKDLDWCYPVKEQEDGKFCFACTKCEHDNIFNGEGTIFKDQQSLAYGNQKAEYDRCYPLQESEDGEFSFVCQHCSMRNEKIYIDKNNWKNKFYCY